MSEINQILNILGFEFDPVDRTLRKKPREHKLDLPELIDGEVLKGIGHSAFYKGDISDLRLPSGLETIKSLAFADNNLHEVIIPPSVRSLGCMSFANNPLNRIVLPTSIDLIDDDAFMGIPGSLKIVCQVDSYAHKFAVERGYIVQALTYREMDNLYDYVGY